MVWKFLADTSSCLHGSNQQQVDNEPKKGTGMGLSALKVRGQLQGLQGGGSSLSARSGLLKSSATYLCEKPF
jgi:hypothetical protein